MGFRQRDAEGRGGYARIWSIEDKGGYSLAKVSTSKKKKDGNGFETDFQHGFVRLVGSAHEKAKELVIPFDDKGNSKGVAIQIVSCEVTTPYNADTKKAYVNYAIFAFDLPEESDTNNASDKKKTTSKSSTKKTKTKKEEVVEEDDEDNDLPF